MKSVMLPFFLLVALLCSLLTQAESSEAVETATPVGPQAVWSPDPAVIRAVSDKCSSSGPSGFRDCFVSVMKDSGASLEAISFTKSIDGTGFLKSFQRVGPVDVAYVAYPFRANENEGCLLVNGAPRFVDIDSLQALPQGEMKADPVYRELAAKFPEALLFPGDRTGASYLAIEHLAGDGKRFIASYKLRNKCHACETLATVKFGFDFDSRGQFLGSRFISITKTTGPNAKLRPQETSTRPNTRLAQGPDSG